MKDMRLKKHPSLLSPSSQNNKKDISFKEKESSPSSSSSESSSESSEESSFSELNFKTITKKYLQKTSKQKNLKNVIYLELHDIHTCDWSLSALGELAINLRQLRFSTSILSSFRDLGTSLIHLQVLWVNASGIIDLDGIGSLVSLTELYLAMNDIVDLTPLSMHENLLCLDLDSNRIKDVYQLELLNTCLALKELTLENNPISKQKQYRKNVFFYCPQVKVLDNCDLSESELSETELLEDEISETEPSEVDEEYALVVGGIKYTTAPNKEIKTTQTNLEPKKGFCESGSFLTHGTDVVFAGNVTRALRRRKVESLQFSNDVEVSHERLSITATLDAASLFINTPADQIELLQELQAWKQEHSILPSPPPISRSVERQKQNKVLVMPHPPDTPPPTSIKR